MFNGRQHGILMDNCFIIDGRIAEIRQTHSSLEAHAIARSPPSCRGRDRQAAAIKGPDIDNYPFFTSLCSSRAALSSFHLLLRLLSPLRLSFPLTYDRLCARTSASATPYAGGDKDFNSWNENCRSI